MRLSLPIVVAITLAVPATASALTDEEAATIQCAAAALVLSGMLGSFVEAGADLHDDYLSLVDRAALDLLLDAEPLFATEEGNAEMGRVSGELSAIVDTAIQEGEVGQWMQQATDEVRVCHTASPRFGAPAQ